MRCLASALLTCALLAGARPAILFAQPASARIVRLDFFRQPLVVRSLTAREITALAAAAGVPMGFEATAAGEPQAIEVQASGRPLGTVLDELVAADRRYEWRDENGVIVLRPAAAWTDGADPLHRNVGAIRFTDVGVVDALAVTVALFGQDLDPSQRVFAGDSRRFDLDLPPGTVLEALNGIARAHGGLSWAVEPVRETQVAPGTVLSPFMVWLASGPSGGGHGIGIRLDREPRVPDELVRTGRPRHASTVPALDRVVGRTYSGEPLVLYSLHQLPELAYAAQSAMGVELLPPGDPRRAPASGIKATGLTLRDALTALVAADPRYEWRDLNGVIVVRPAPAWSEPAHPLLRGTGPVHLERVTLIEAIDFQHALLEPGLSHGSEPPGGDGPRITVDLPAGTHLALANAIVQAHGSACWLYEELGARDTAFFGGRPHQLSITALPGGGQGFAFR